MRRGDMDAWVPPRNSYAGPQTTEDMLSESPRCNDMVANLLFPRFFGTPIQCEITRRFPRSVVKVGLNVQCKNISRLGGFKLELRRIQTYHISIHNMWAQNVQSQRNVCSYYNNVLLIPSPESPDDVLLIIPIEWLNFKVYLKNFIKRKIN